ncbi:DUF4192 family protein [Kitasatospora sp. NPDC050543]|uniref:DUF4192 family protein n=1 Tax=Kitasatospora sp. NPDC050543 TaxID=3364054 RepID=UPI0037A4080F
MCPAAGGAAPGRHGAHFTSPRPRRRPARPSAARKAMSSHTPNVPHPAHDDAHASALVHDVFHDFADELAAGHESMKRRMLLLLDSAMASDHAAGALADRDVARLLLAVQNGLVFDAATEYCEAPETARAARLWNRVIRLCVGRHETLAGAPYALLGLALLLDGDNAGASAALTRAAALRPDHPSAEALVAILEIHMTGRRVGVDLGTVGPMRRRLRSERAPSAA